MKILLKVSEIMQNRYIKILAAALLATFIFGTILTHYFMYSLNESLPYRIWHKNIKPDVIVKNDYVLFLVPKENPYISISSKLIKQIACMPADMLQTKTIYLLNEEPLKAYYCNDKVMRVALKTDALGNSVESVDFDEPVIIPKNKYFVLGTHERSYDSRYLGLIDISHITAVMDPIF